MSQRNPKANSKRAIYRPRHKGLEHLNEDDTKHNFNERFRGGSSRRDASEPVYFGVTSLSGPDTGEAFEPVTEENYRQAARIHGSRNKASSSRRGKALPSPGPNVERASNSRPYPQPRSIPSHNTNPYISFPTQEHASDRRVHYNPKNPQARDIPRYPGPFIDPALSAPANFPNYTTYPSHAHSLPQTQNYGGNRTMEIRPFDQNFPTLSATSYTSPQAPFPIGNAQTTDPRTHYFSPPSTMPHPMHSADGLDAQYWMQGGPNAHRNFPSYEAPFFPDHNSEVSQEYGDLPIGYASNLVQPSNEPYPDSYAPWNQESDNGN